MRVHQTIEERSVRRQVFRSSQLGYCIRDSPRFHLLSTSNQLNQETDIFLHRILQCISSRRHSLASSSSVNLAGPIQRFRIGLASFDWNYFDEDRLVLLSGKEYFDYVIPTRSSIVSLELQCVSLGHDSRFFSLQSYSPRNGLLWNNAREIHPSLVQQDAQQLTSKVMFNYDPSSGNADRRSAASTPVTSNVDVCEPRERDECASTVCLPLSFSLPFSPSK